MIRLTMDEMQTLLRAKAILGRFTTMTTYEADGAKDAHRALGRTLENVALKMPE